MVVSNDNDKINHNCENGMYDINKNVSKDFQIQNNSDFNNTLLENIPFTSLSGKYNNNNEDNADNSYKEELTHDDKEYQIMLMNNNLVTYKLTLFSIQLMVILTLIQTKDLVIFPFVSRVRDAHLNEAFSTLAIIYHIVLVTIPLSLTQGYSYKAAETFSAKNFYHLGILTNKIYFTLIIVALLLSLMFVFFLGPYFSIILVNKTTVGNLTTMFLWLSLGTIFAYLQIGVMRFLNAIDKVHISLICTLIGSISQLIFLVVYYNTWDLSAFSLAMAININCFTAYCFQIIYIVVFNPCREASSLAATDGVTEDYWSFIKYTFLVGSMFFFTMLTFDMHSYIGLLLNVDSFVVLNLLCILLLSFYVVCLGISAGNNLLINYLIGRKLYDRILSVFLYKHYNCNNLFSYYEYYFCIVLRKYCSHVYL